MPGEPERRRRALRLAHGIEVDERTWAEIVAAADTLGLDAEQIARPGRLRARAWNGSTAW